MKPSKETKTKQQLDINQKMYILKEIEILQAEIHSLKRTRLIIVIVAILILGIFGFISLAFPAVNKKKKIFELENKINVLRAQSFASPNTRKKTTTSSTTSNK